MTRKLNWLLLALIAVLGAPYYWFLLETRPGDAAAKPVTIDQLRALAESVPGAKPDRVTYELAAFDRLPGNLLVAGSGMKRKLIGIMAWRLEVPGGKPVMIDSGIQRKTAESMSMELFIPDAQARIERAMGESGLILLTHEHPDHAGGVTALASNRQIRARVRLNPAEAKALQLAGPNPLPSGTQPFAVAPGIVIIPAPSHTPGSQLVYVLLADRHELLFVGDVASFAQNWQEIRARSRLVGQYYIPENRAEVFAWLRTIAALKRSDPTLFVIPGHDFEWVYDTRNKVPAQRGIYEPVG